MVLSSSFQFGYLGKCQSHLFKRGIEKKINKIGYRYCEHRRPMESQSSYVFQPVE
jgi:hypothetical protein